MDTRTSSGDLFDFDGTAHPGVDAGTTVVEGRSGFARKFAGGTDGVVLSQSGTVSITTGVTAHAYVLLSSFPSSDVAVLARKGQFYLNVTSDGRAQWTLHGAGSVVSALSLPLNRWVRLSGAASKVSNSASTSSLYVEGVLVASRSGGKFPTASNAITIGYAEGQAHLVGAIDEVLVLATAASSGTIADLGVRGGLLNPNATDTDADGLADGQSSS